MPFTFDLLTGLSRPARMLVATVFVLSIGVADHYSGNSISSSAIYALPIAFATWLVGWRFATLLAFVSVGLWMFGQVTNEPANPMLLPNAGIKIVSYGLFIAFLAGLREYQQKLQKRVDERTTALIRQITERERLERELLAVSEREQRRIGQDLHDSLCQHLTGTALAAESVADKLVAQDRKEAVAAQQVVELIGDAIVQARNLAKGLNPVDMYADALMDALDDFAATTSDLFHIACRFECAYPVMINDPAAAGQLYRIAQEAVSNAIKHGSATSVVIALDVQEEGAVLSIDDNGSGFTQPEPANGGMGLRIMSHRARVIGATLDIQRNTRGGTTVTCAFPPEPRMEEVGHA
jgi:signal transduction histidine kinase